MFRLQSVPALLCLSLVLGGCRQPEPASTQPVPAPEQQPSQADEQTGPDDGGASKFVATGDGLAVGKQGAVTSAEANATDIGLSILKKGGNAVDAAIAVGFALGVTHPSAGNIGGGGFMVVRLPDGTSHALDYREMAPGAASRDMYLDAKGDVTNDSRLGPKAAGIPGVVAGFAYAHKNWGSLPWPELVEPAVALARDGWVLDKFHADDLAWGSKRMRGYLDELRSKNPKGSKKQQQHKRLIAAVEATLKTFQKPDGSNYVEGERWQQPELATTLKKIAEAGPDGFYRGEVAKKLATEVQAMGGLWTEKDLAGYVAVERQPLQFEYHGHGVITMPPPSAGGVVLRQILAASEVLELASLGWDTPERIHLYIEALRRTYADRNLLIGDPDFIKIPMDTLLDVTYVGKRMSDIDRNKATPSKQVGAGVTYRESSQTTHFSVVDKDGRAVANTYTLNGGFGAKVQVPGTGVTLNNEMDDFTAKVGAPNMFGLIQGPQNSIEAKKRMLSSMTPTIVTKNGKLRAVVGSPGGPTITTTVAQIVMQLIDHKRSIAEAVAATRLHHQWLPDMIWYEEDLAPKHINALKQRGHEMKTRGRIGHANCIEVAEESGEIRAVADVTRDGGKASAY